MKGSRWNEEGQEKVERKDQRHRDESSLRKSPQAASGASQQGDKENNNICAGVEQLCLLDYRPARLKWQVGAHRAGRFSERAQHLKNHQPWQQDHRSEEHTSELQSLRHLVC